MNGLAIRPEMVTKKVVALPSEAFATHVEYKIADSSEMLHSTFRLDQTNYGKRLVSSETGAVPVELDVFEGMNALGMAPGRRYGIARLGYCKDPIVNGRVWNVSTTDSENGARRLLVSVRELESKTAQENGLSPSESQNGGLLFLNESDVEKIRLRRDEYVSLLPFDVASPISGNSFDIIAAFDKVLGGIMRE